MSAYQSVCRKFHSPETTLLRVQNDILISLDSGHFTALLLLDLSAAFDTTDYNILLHRLQHWFGISSSALLFLSSFLSNRFLTVLASNSKSQPILLEFRCSTWQCFRAFPLFTVHYPTLFYHLQIPWHPFSLPCE